MTKTLHAGTDRAKLAAVSYLCLYCAFPLYRITLEVEPFLNIHIFRDKSALGLLVLGSVIFFIFKIRYYEKIDIDVLMEKKEKVFKV
ncbi:MAG: hypothetical protein ACLVKO_08150 [Dysgonomonas sp.]